MILIAAIVAAVHFWNIDRRLTKHTADAEGSEVAGDE